MASALALSPKLGGIQRQRTVWITEQPEQRRLFADHYEILSSIGVPGQFGKAFRCRKKSDGQCFVVKEISKARLYRLESCEAKREQLLKYMRDEISILQRLDHPYIVRMYDTFESKHTLHIVMEECKGGELFDRIQTKGRIPEKEAISIIRKICKALFYMHESHKVVHCDLKPENILFADQTEDSDIKIIDFGLSKVLPRLRALRDLCGTSYYMAPEVIQRTYSHAADMWSVGVIAFLMIFGYPPFHAQSANLYGRQEAKAVYRLIMRGFDPTLKPGFGAWFPLSLRNKLSDDGRDFIKHLLCSNVAQRLTAKEALEHPWLNQTERRGSFSLPSLSSSASSSLPPVSGNPKLRPSDTHSSEYAHLQFINFATSKQFKFAVAALFRAQYESMRPKHFENLRKLFHELDEDHNGKISLKEFQEGMLRCTELKLSKRKLRKLFEELDMNKMGEIDFGSLLNAAVHDYLIASDLRLYHAFRELDENSTGRIPTKLLKQKVAELDPYGNVEALLSIIDAIDLDQDGYIDYEEFLRALHPDFNESPKWLRTATHRADNDDDGQSEDEPDSVSMNTDEKNSGEQLEPGQLGSAIGRASILHMGYLFKQGKLFRSWKRRWFILLENGVMCYFRHRSDATPIARFDCKQCSKLVMLSLSRGKKRRFGIQVDTPHRDWKLVCANDEERDQWIRALESVSLQKAERQ